MWLGQLDRCWEHTEERTARSTTREHVPRVHSSSLFPANCHKACTPVSRFIACESTRNIISPAYLTRKFSIVKHKTKCRCVFVSRRPASARPLKNNYQYGLGSASPAISCSRRCVAGLISSGKASSANSCRSEISMEGLFQFGSCSVSFTLKSPT